MVNLTCSTSRQEVKILDCHKYSDDVIDSASINLFGDSFNEVRRNSTVEYFGNEIHYYDIYIHI